MAFNNWLRSKNRTIYQSIYRNIYEDEYPEEADPDGYVTLRDLNNFIKYLGVGPGEKIVDLGCGRGGPGMWIARALRVDYMGIDVAEGGVESAKQRINDFGLLGKADFQVGDMAGATGLPDEFFDGAISIDTISFIRDNLAVFYETARILRPGACFVFTSWEQNLPKRINDYRPLLQKTGFNVERYEQTHDWERLQRKSYQTVLKLKEKIIKELGEAESKGLIREAEKKLPRLNKMRRVFVVARKT